MLCGGLVAAGFLAQAAVTSATAVPAPVVVLDDAVLGTEENPYTVQDVLGFEAEMTADKNFKIPDVWVEAYIVGMVDGSNWDKDAIMGVDGETDTNIIIANDPVRIRYYIPVKLPSGDVRNELNLVANPGNYKKHVLLKGTIGKEFGVPGMEKITEYKFIEDGVEIDYSEFICAFMDFEDDDNSVYTEMSGEGNKYAAEGVVLDGTYSFLLANSDMQKMFLATDETVIDESNLTCTLEYVDMDNATGMPSGAPVEVTLTGEYDVNVVYDGEKAEVTFVAAGGETPVVIDYSHFFLALQPYSEDEDNDFVTLEGEGNEYKAEFVEINGFYTFSLVDLYNQGRTAFIGEGAVTDQNLTCTLNYVDLDKLGEDANPDFPVLNLSGFYDITVVYDGTEATVTFVPVGGPTINYADFALVLMNQEGEMIPVTLEGEGNEFKAEGVKITSAYNMFLLGDISTGEMTTMFVGDLSISNENLSGELVYYNPAVDMTEPGWPTIELDGTYNVYVVYEGNDAVVTFEKQEERVLSEYALIINNHATYGQVTADGGILFKNVKFEVAEGTEGSDFLIRDNFFYSHSYGDWDVTIDDRHLNAVLPESQMPALVKLTGYYDVTVKFGEDMAYVDVSFVKVGGLTTTVNVVVEDGMSFSYEAANFTASKFKVATGDSYWGIDGYTLNGEANTFTDPVRSYTHEFTAANECNFIFTTHFLGEIKFLDETTGMVDFDESAVQIMIVNGRVEIENLTPGEEVMVYTVGGQIISSAIAHNTNMSIELTKGIYVVRAGKVAAKVSL